MFDYVHRSVSRTPRLASLMGVMMMAGMTLTANAGDKPFSLPKGDGHYRTETVSSQSACIELCQSDRQCRGTTTYQADIRYPVFECRLNNGFGSESPFAIKAPDPLIYETALRDLNAYRARQGLGALRYDTKLNTASQIHAEDLAAHDTISHTGSDGSDHAERAKREGYRYAVIAENVATGQKSWTAVFKAWQNSPGHNKNLLRRDVTDFGIAMTFDPTTDHMTYWSMLVGKPLEIQKRRPAPKFPRRPSRLQSAGQS